MGSLSYCSDEREFYEPQGLEVLWTQQDEIPQANAMDDISCVVRSLDYSYEPCGGGMGQNKN